MLALSDIAAKAEIQLSDLPDPGFGRDDGGNFGYLLV
jgi:hypothetical protein